MGERPADDHDGELVSYRANPLVSDDALNSLFAAGWQRHVPSDFTALHRHSLAYICAFDADTLVGYVNLAWDGGLHAFLLDTTVHPNWRRRGIGRGLVRQAVEAALERGVEWLHVDYEPHLADFYRACGFRPTKAGLIHLGFDGDTVSLSPSDRVKTSTSRSTTLSEVPIFSGDAAKHLAPTLQLEMIERLRVACRDDLRVIAATLYGSCATGEADACSDIEAALYFVPEALATLDRQAWVAQIAPAELFFADDFGHYTAIFANLVRGEFHFHAADRIPEVAGWRGSAWFPSVEAAVLVDRTGELSRQIDGLEHAPPDRDTPEMAARLAANFANGVLFGSQVLARGEAARSLEVLVFTLRYLEWLARLVEGNVAHWPTPSRRWERDLSAETQARLIDCTARSSRAELARAYRNAWAWGRSLAETLAQRHGLVLPDALYDRISQRVNASQEGLEWQ